MFADERLGIVDGIFQCREGVLVTHIAEGHRRVAEKAASLGALNGTTLELSVEG